jgi:2-dehydro-3-deoxyphosphogluconate aldolase/(4S)-4-hydroxy-2-oxoglutarate aldolase
MDLAAVRARIRDVGIIPAIRTDSAAAAQFAAETLRDAGVSVVEITMTVPGALEVMKHLSREARDLVIGAGTVFDVDTARRCLDAGAHFVTSPGFDPDVVLAVKGHGVTMPGALTPSEVTRARMVGADFVKVFPIMPAGGPQYMRALVAPFPDVAFVAAGGIDHHSVAPLIEAGATAIGVGRELIPRRALEGRRVDWIAELARRFVILVQEAKRHGREG